MNANKEEESKQEGSEIKENESFFHIDRDLISIKALYFVQYGALVAFFPFFNIWLESVGLNGTQIGLMSSVRQLTYLIGSPFWAGLSDKYSIHKKVLLYVVAVCVTLRVSMTLMGGSFPYLIVLLFLSEFHFSVVGAMLDRICLHALGERKHLYGKQRLWGTISWGLLSTPLGKLVEWTGNSNWFLYIHGIGMIFFFLLLIKVKVPSVAKSTAPFWKSLSIVANLKAFVFLTAMIIVGIQNGVLNNYLFLHLRHLNASNTLLGLCLMMNCIAELPLLFYAGEITKRITPQGGLMLTAVAAFIRFMGYGIITNPWYALPLELTHGITFGVMWASAVQIASGLAPPHLGATMQGILSAVYAGIGSLIGAAVGGFLFQRYEDHFFLMGSLLPLTLFIYYGSFLLYDHLNAKKGDTSTQQSYAMVELEVPEDLEQPKTVGELVDRLDKDENNS